MKIKFKNKTIVIRSPFVVYKYPTMVSYGLTNRTSDNYFMVFLDYDLVEDKVVLEDVNFLQKNFNLGNALIRISSKEYVKEKGCLVGSFHVFFFTKLLFPEVKEIISLTRCDSHFKYGYKYQQRCWVLRIGEKLENNTIKKPFTKFYKFIPHKTMRVSSKGLIKFFSLIDSKNYKKKFKKIDNLNNIEIINYAT